MLKNFNLLFIIILFNVCFTLTEKSISKLSSLKTNTNFFVGCWRYGTDADEDQITNIDQTNAFITNKRNNDTDIIAYFDNKATCKKNCIRPNTSTTYGCYKSNNKWDKLVGIPSIKKYVCWIKNLCKESHDSLFKNRDSDLFDSTKKGCKFLCRSAYRFKGKCLQNEGVWECFYKDVTPNKIYTKRRHTKHYQRMIFYKGSKKSAKAATKNSIK